MKYNLHIHVKQKHIDAGTRKCCKSCPISLAINDCLKPEYKAKVGDENVIKICYSDRMITQYMTLLPKDVFYFMDDFDCLKNVKPFVFVLPNVDERMITGLM